MNAPVPNLRIEENADGRGGWKLFLSGRLDAGTVARLWPQALAAVRARMTRMARMARMTGDGKGDAGAPENRILTIDCGGVDYCDDTGFALLLELRRQAQERPGAAVEKEKPEKEEKEEKRERAVVAVVGLSDAYRRLFEQYDDADFDAPSLPPRASFTEQVGATTVRIVRDVRDLIAFVGELGLALAHALRHPRSVRWQDTLSFAEQVGARALPIVSLIAFLLGVILAFQSAVAMRKFGAELYVSDLLGLSLLRELAPLMTAILLAGRSGAAFAAELGTMRVNEEVDALTTMGLEPVRFLVVPRLLAAVAMTPLLAVYAGVIGLAGGALVLQAGFGIPLSLYLNEINSVVHWSDFVGGLGKALVFGILVAAVGCMRGLQASTGAAAVGGAATSAVVSGIVLIVLADGFFAWLFFLLDW